jgi:deoxyribonuclease V
MEILKTYQACFDVKYYDDFALIGYVIFEDNKSDTAFKTGQCRHEKIEPYVSGEFYKRELPCLLTAIKQITEKINLIYIDANVWLGENSKGLGCHLYEALDCKIPVIGISKTSFLHAEKQVVPVLRTNSTKPLYVSAIGIDIAAAIKLVAEMDGDFRLPTMVKLADTMSRSNFD